MRVGWSWKVLIFVILIFCFNISYIRWIRWRSLLQSVVPITIYFTLAKFLSFYSFSRLSSLSIFELGVIKCDPARWLGWDRNVSALTAVVWVRFTKILGSRFRGSPCLGGLTIVTPPELTDGFTIYWPGYTQWVFFESRLKLTVPIKCWFSRLNIFRFNLIFQISLNSKIFKENYF